LAVVSASAIVRIMCSWWRGNNAKAELCQKILGEAEKQQVAGICSLYDAAEGKFVEGMDVRKVAEYAAKGMAGNETHDPEWSMHWILGPSLKDRSDPTGFRKEILTFFMTIVLSNAVLFPKEGCVIASRDEKNEISAVNMVRVFRSGYRKSLGEKLLWDLRTVVRCLFAGTMPKLYTDSAHKQLSKYVDARVKKGISVVMPKMHAKHASGPHYYVAVMSTLPDKQGQGHCSKLMRAVSRAADMDGLPCYLECTGERNRDIYKRFGYEVVEEQTLSVENDEAGTELNPTMYAMVRHPHGQPVAQVANS
jgi:ribosomal protein S18 acetylase RimI-like enzyme